jgi:putative tryptophan/tyrosine transport system substrate-binding protein
MRRRKVLALLAGAVAWPCVAQAQRPKRVGILLQGGPYYSGIEGLREGLKALGLEESRELAFIVRDARGDLTAVEAAARALERDGVDVIVAFATSVALAAQRATVDVPIVFSVSSDPVGVGLVESIPRPGGRLTGVHNINTDLTAKRLEIIAELVPGLRRVLTYYNPANVSAILSVRLARDAAQKLGIDLIERHVSTTEQLLDHLSALRAADADAYFFVSDAMVNSQETAIVERANALHIPTIAPWAEAVRRGALVGYGISYRELGRGAAGYVKRILAGMPARELPVEAVNRPALAINPKTARTLGLTIPPTLLARADEVIE